MCSGGVRAGQTGQLPIDIDNIMFMGASTHNKCFGLREGDGRPTGIEHCGICTYVINDVRVHFLMPKTAVVKIRFQN